MAIEVSVPIICYKPYKLLLDAVESIGNSDFPKDKYEVLLVYEYEPKDDTIAKLSRLIKELGIHFRMKKIPAGRGFGYERNRSIEMAKGKYLIVTDADCTVPKNWFSLMYNAIKSSEDDVAVIVGSARIPKSTFLGDCISLLGFPGGANVGFDKIHRVSKEGCTKQISNCNCAMKKEIIDSVGGYHENLYDIEDKGLALKLHHKGYKVKFLPESTIYHVARTSFWGFCKWQNGRGRSAKGFMRHHKTYKGEMLSTRLWSIKNVILAAKPAYRLPVVLFLLIAGYICQTWGYVLETISPSEKKIFY